MTPSLHIHLLNLGLPPKLTIHNPPDHPQTIHPLTFKSLTHCHSHHLQICIIMIAILLWSHHCPSILIHHTKQEKSSSTVLLQLSYPPLGSCSHLPKLVQPNRGNHQMPSHLCMEREVRVWAALHIHKIPGTILMKAMGDLKSSLSSWVASLVEQQPSLELDFWSTFS